MLSVIRPSGDQDLCVAGNTGFICARNSEKTSRHRTPGYRKLGILHSANDLRVLAELPGNRLEKLRGERAGQYSIRINDQWRICFIWQDGNAYKVEIVDYH